MTGRGVLRVILLFAALSVECGSCAFGQLPRRVERCLPYQEIRDMRAAGPRVTVRVSRVEFDSEDGIPVSIREKISAQLRSRVFEPDEGADYLKDVANEIAEVDVIGGLQNDGYFKAMAEAKLAAIQVEGGEISVVARINATPGAQYRAGDVRIESADGTSLAFSPDVLRSSIPLERGELFKVERIRAGLENLRRVYGREGYVDMTAEVETAFDDERERIETVLRIDQGAQYRVGSIEFLGVNAVTREKLVESLPRSGEIIDTSRVGDFFTVNRGILPPDASSDDVTIERDGRSKTVAVLFDLRSCPGN